MQSNKIPVAVLGATGSVGQRFIQLLDGHPWFEVVALTGSERSAGNKYYDYCRWILNEPMPDWAKSLVIHHSDPEMTKVPLAFSALPSHKASEIEPLYAQAGVAVCTNAGAYRREKDVPILLPEINPDQTVLVDSQRQRRGWGGLIVTNPNCTTTGVSVVLKVFQELFGVNKAFMVSLQALSGAGYPGVPSMDIIDNVIPFIEGEEEKLEWEPLKILGTLNNGFLSQADFLISAHANRVAVSDGHLVCLSVQFNNPPSEDQIVLAVQDALSGYKMPEISSDLPSSPNPVIALSQEKDRPQPRLDRKTGEGMTTVVGRIRRDPILDIKLAVLSHNTIRGAAGGSIYNAELLVKKGYISDSYV
ncbi:aspartate-semialdehyde dehydrogenase [Chloroflexota bacterium]